MDVLLSHPTMTTKGGVHSPPARRRQLTRKPTFEIPLKDSSVGIGQRAEFSASVKGNPLPLVTWFADDVPIRSGSVYRYIKDGDKHILMIPNVKLNSGCVITCKAVNQHGETTSTAKLTVIEITDVTVKTNELTIETKSEVEFDERMEIEDVVDSQLSKSELEITNASETTYTQFQSTIELNRSEISATLVEDTTVTILEGSMLSETTFPSIEGKIPTQYFGSLETSIENRFTRDSLLVSPTRRSPRLVRFSEESLLQEYPTIYSDSSELCSETSSIASLRNISVLKDSEWMDEVRKLIREEIDKREKFKEQRVVEKVSDETQTSIEVEFESNSPAFINPIRDCFITAGETAHFVYILNATPPAKVTWQRNGVNITQSGDNVGIIEDNDAGCLLISGANLTHSGVFTCIAENEYGSTKCSAKLMVSPNARKFTKSTSTFEESGIFNQTDRQFRSQESQTFLATANQSSECATEPTREINDNETGEGGKFLGRCISRHVTQHVLKLLSDWREIGTVFAWHSPVSTSVCKQTV
uniref:titin-like n=1 Tax=Styela clava TaxID=7725 RepID=UPI00193953F3|nr:titin-like [Styela clava]